MPGCVGVRLGGWPVGWLEELKLRLTQLNFNFNCLLELSLAKNNVVTFYFRVVILFWEGREVLTPFASVFFLGSNKVTPRISES